MQKVNSKKPIIISVAVIIIIILAYFYFTGTPNDASSSLVYQEGSSEAALASSKVLTLLNQINSLKIDPKIFGGALFQSLVDYTVVVPEQNVGKPNPFSL
ncbi:MAG TPA: hypothetical protein VJC02_00570 [Candidatus Paceibacterota bacterium]